MAKFSSMSVTTNVKQGLERGPQGVIQSAVFDIPKQMATTFVIEKALGLKYLAGTGLVNPALTVNLSHVVSGLKEGVRRLIEGTETQNLSSVGSVSGRTDEPTAKEKPPVSTFNSKGLQGETLYRAAETPASKKDISSKGEAFVQQKFALKRGDNYSTLGTSSKDTAASLAQPANTPEKSGVQPVVNARIDPIDSVANSTDQKFSELRPATAPTSLSSIDLKTSAVITYPKELTDIKLITETRPFLKGPLAAKPKLNGVKEFKSLREENGVTSTGHPSALSSADKDTGAAQPVSGGDASTYEAEVARGHRTGIPQRGNSKSKNIFTTVDDMSGAEAKIHSDLRPSTARMSEVKKYGKYAKRNYEQGSDFYGYEEFAQSHRFYVVDSTGDQKSVFEYEEGKPQKTLAAGFSTCTSPKFELASKEVKEGTWEFPRVFCTGATVQTLTLSKGLIKTETGFYLWILNAMRGMLTRRTIEIVAYDREPRNSRAWLRAETLPSTSSCVWKLYNCYPLAYRSSQGFDADSGKILVSELDIHYEWFEERVGVVYQGTSIL